MLTKMKAVTVKMHNVLVNVNNFLCMKLCLGRFKGEARHCDFTLPMGQTFYTDKMIMHTLVKRLEDAPYSKICHGGIRHQHNLQNRLTLKKEKKNTH